jgi:hypothetical protein
MGKLFLVHVISAFGFELGEIHANKALVPAFILIFENN